MRCKIKTLTTLWRYRWSINRKQQGFQDLRGGTWMVNNCDYLMKYLQFVTGFNLMFQTLKCPLNCIFFMRSGLVIVNFNNGERAEEA